MNSIQADLTASQQAELKSSPLFNPDLAPVSAAQRKWRAGSFAALWISMSACIPTYMLASSLIGGGMNWSQAIFTIFLGNLIVLIPMILNAGPGLLNDCHAILGELFRAIHPGGWLRRLFGFAGRSPTKIALPPIHAWMPNQPHATSARSNAGTFAPSVPNAARQ